MVPELFVFDFDGTLAERPGMWLRCLLDVLDEHLPGHEVTSEALRPLLRSGFPWHRADVAHPELSDPDRWWEEFGALLDRVYTAVGVASSELSRLRALVREHYCDPTRFQLFPDTVNALETVRQHGLRAAILSNHVPELDVIVRHLGLDALVDDVITSARIGYEKPHPEAFAVALAGTTPDRACMIGDNPTADKQGAIDIGMTGVLVRHAAADHATVGEAVDALLAGVAAR